MAKGKKTGGRDIKKGERLNPNGRPRMPEYMKAAKKLNKIKFEEILNKYINCTIDDLQMHLKDKNTPALDLIVIKVLLEGIKRGDEKRLGFVLDRLIGKVKDSIEITADINMDEEKTLEEISERRKQLEKRLREIAD